MSFAFLQAGVVHRDLKPANVLFRSETGRETGRRDALKVANPRHSPPLAPHRLPWSLANGFEAVDVGAYEGSVGVGASCSWMQRWLNAVRAADRRLRAVAVDLALAVPARLAAGGKVILTAPCLFCMEVYIMG